MKVNYPVKYTAMPVIEQVGWSHGMHELERESDVVCYIVSKCFLINDTTKYEENGQSVKEYEVVFPYQKSEYRTWKRCVPEFNLMSGYCINSNRTKHVFNTYEEALNYVNVKNEELFEKTCVYLPYFKIKSKKDEFQTKVDKCKLLEFRISKLTEELVVDKKNSINGLISIKDNKGKVMSLSLYAFIKFFKRLPFIVYTVTDEQYDRLKKCTSYEEMSKVESVIDKSQILLVNIVSDKMIRIFSQKLGNGYYLDCNEILCYSDKFSSIDKSIVIKPDTVKIFTTETSEDVIYSYKKHDEIDLAEEEGAVLRKTVK